MKKLTKLVSAIALLCAMALVGCANPNNTNNGTKDPSNNENGSKIPTISVSDLKKPAGFTSESNPVKNAKEGNTLIGEVFEETDNILGASFDYTETTENYVTANKKIKEDAETQMKENKKIVDAATAKGEAWSVTRTDSKKPGIYESDDKNIVYNIIEYSGKNVESDDPINKKASSITEHVEKTNIKVLDASKIKIRYKTTSYNPKYVKTLVANNTVNSNYTYEKSGDAYDSEVGGGTETGSMNNALYAISMFEKDGKNGIVEMKVSVTVSGEGATTLIPDESSVVFYDLNGKKQYTYTSEEVKALFGAMMQ